MLNVLTGLDETRGRHRRHEAGIDPAAQKDPDRHVRDQPEPYRIEEAASRELGLELTWIRTAGPSRGSGSDQ